MSQSPGSVLDERIAEDAHLWARRIAAGWDVDPEYGWFAPDGTSERDWLIEGHPLPEDPDYLAWADAFYHYELLDSTCPTP